MLITPDRLIDGVMRALTEEVLPDVTTPFARGQLYAAVDVLRNLRDRIEERIAPRRTELESARAALTTAVDALRHTGATVAAQAIDDMLHAGTASDTASHPMPPTASVTPGAAGTAAVPAPPDPLTTVRRALVTALATLDGLTPAIAGPARAALAAHLGAQVMRDIEPLKPSMLGEISQG